MAIRLVQRKLEPEWMDQPDLDHTLHGNALRSLARLNRISRSAHILWPSIRQLAQETAAPRLRVLDMASGAGDVSIQLWQLAARHGLELQVLGMDVSPLAVEHARRKATELGAGVAFRQGDVFQFHATERFDVVMCSLFLHHQEQSAAVALLRKMSAVTNHMLLVNDLDRGPAGYTLAWLATRLLTRSPVVRTDGPRSVAAAFTPSEALELAAAAGLHGARVVRRWPCRWLLSWRKPA